MEEGEGVAEAAQGNAPVVVLSVAATGEVKAAADQEADPEDQAVTNHLTIATQGHAEHNASFDGFRKQNSQRSSAYQPCRNSTQNRNPRDG